MEQVKVCRICLEMGVKMFNLKLFPLETYFERLLEDNPLNSLDLPPYACYQCIVLLKKYYHFREKCLLSQSILCGILHTNGKITAHEINQLDRLYLNLTSNIKPANVTEENTIFIVHDDNPNREVKEEPNYDQGFPDNDDVPLSPLKVEDDLDCFDVGVGVNASSDDEPLSLHKSNKEKREKKKERKGRKRKEKEVVEDADCTKKLQTIDAPIDLPTEIEELFEQKRKRGRPRKATPAPPGPPRPRGRPRKSPGEAPRPRRARRPGAADDDVDIEEYVTVIKLSTQDQLDEISSRQSSANYLNAPHQCQLCYKGFIDAAAWKHHRSKHEASAGDVECPICKFRFKSRRTLQKHATNHAKRFCCRACPYVSKTTTQAKQHQRWHKGVTYKCQYCDEISTKWTSFLSHVRIKHPSHHICDVCGYSFVSQVGLAMHRTMMHKDVAQSAAEASDAPYCEQCDVKFVSVEAYKRHMVTSSKHAETNDFSTGCRACGSTFADAEALRLHHRREHARARPKNYGKKRADRAWPAPCEHCSELIPNAREHWTHFRRAHPDKSYPIQRNYVCDVCGKSFRGNAFLVYHKRTHSGERAYKCAQCPKAFFNRTNLQMHEKTHSDSRPYPCDVCCKGFKCKGALDRHYRSHTGVKPYSCEVCGKAFGQSNSRKLHVRTVHLRQPAPYLSRSRLDRRRAPAAPPVDAPAVGAPTPHLFF